MAFLAELGDSYERIGADRSGRVAIDWGVYGLPETFVIDAEGRVSARFEGLLSEDELAEALRAVDP